MLSRLRFGSLGALVLSLGITNVLVAQTFLGPTPYLQTSDSPLLSLSGFAVDNLEDGALDVPGVTADFGHVLAPSTLTDSVDNDDGALDGFGLDGHSWFGNGGLGVRFTFDAAQIGFVPKSAGVVWTDGTDPISFEAFDTNGASLGVVIGNHSDDSFGGQTAEDRFYGISYAAGIGSIRMTNGGGIELDHVQYANEVVVPEPDVGTFLLLTIAGLLACMRPRYRTRSG